VNDPEVVPDAAEATEMEELIRSVPRLIGLLPDVLREHRIDVRHAATLARMIGMLMKVVDKVKPAVLVSFHYTSRIMTFHMELTTVRDI
jgi:nuclear pore complex protein Nup98-Nup96